MNGILAIVAAFSTLFGGAGISDEDGPRLREVVFPARALATCVQAHEATRLVTGPSAEFAVPGIPIYDVVALPDAEAARSFAMLLGSYDGATGKSVTATGNVIEIAYDGRVPTRPSPTLAQVRALRACQARSAIVRYAPRSARRFHECAAPFEPDASGVLVRGIECWQARIIIAVFERFRSNTEPMLQVHICCSIFARYINLPGDVVVMYQWGF